VTADCLASCISSELDLGVKATATFTSKEATVSPKPYFGVSATRHSMFVKLTSSEHESPLEYPEQAWEDFIEKYTPLIFGVCKTFAIQNADAEDITQSTILKVLSELKQGKFAYDSQHRFRGWLATVTGNAIRDGFRKMKRMRHGQQDFLEAIPEESLVDALEHEVHQRYLLGQSLDRLKEVSNPEHWRVFQVRVLEERTTKEAAKILGKSEGSIDVTCSRLRLKLKTISDQLLRESEQLGIPTKQPPSKRTFGKSDQQ